MKISIQIWGGRGSCEDSEDSRRCGVVKIMRNCEYYETKEVVKAVGEDFWVQSTACGC